LFVWAFFFTTVLIAIAVLTYVIQPVWLPPSTSGLFDLTIALCVVQLHTLLVPGGLNLSLPITHISGT